MTIIILFHPQGTARKMNGNSVFTKRMFPGGRKDGAGSGSAGQCDATATLPYPGGKTIRGMDSGKFDVGGIGEFWMLFQNGA